MAVMRALIVTSVTLVAALVGYLSPSERDLAPEPTHASLFPAALHAQLWPETGALWSQQLQQYAFGRARAPASTLAFHVDGSDNGWLQKLKTLATTKRWHYMSIDTPSLFVGMAIVQLGYVGDAFLYVVDKNQAHEKFEFAGRLPGSIGTMFAASSIDDQNCTSFQSVLGEDSLAFCYDSDQRGWRINANVTAVGELHAETRQFTAELFLHQEEALAFLFPLGNSTLRPAYVHKGAGSPVRGSFKFGQAPRVELASQRALGAIDWTRSLALRCTRWKWASASFLASVQTTHADGSVEHQDAAAVGINLSSDVYDIDGESQENAVWINGRVFVLRGVSFSVPAQPTKERWAIQTSSNELTHESVALSFTPLGCRADLMKLVVVESDFVQPYGLFNGHIQFSTDDAAVVRVSVSEAFGVVENHFAIW